MPLDANTWKGVNTYLTDLPDLRDDTRAVDAWNHIQERPTTIDFLRPDGSDFSQTVRIEQDTRATESQTAAGAAPNRTLIIFGVRGHPDAGIADTEIAKDYRIFLDNRRYDVIDVIDVSGGIQAFAEVIG